LLPIVSSKPAAAGASRDRGRLQLWAAVADAPLDAYSAEAINQGLTDLDWVSRAAVAHEAIVESFITAPAVLPMKLFTIFTSDDRALAHVIRERPQLQAMARRVMGQHEWGIRVVLDRSQAVASAATRRPVPVAGRTGAGYLQRKKAQHDAAAKLAQRSRDVVADLYDRLARQATAVARRGGADLPAPGAPLLLDAAYLVPRRRTRTFQSAVARHARTLMPQGYRVTLTGPWPPYTFMQD
jgi:hypothetical protein